MVEMLPLVDSRDDAKHQQIQGQRESAEISHFRQRLGTCDRVSIAMVHN